MNKRYLIIVELLWAVIGLTSFTIAVREFINKGKQAWVFLAMAVFSFMLAGIREYQRKKS
ncbi:MAG TPA: hypothetical protein PKH02_06175 [Bacteroidales bacterium]|nr:hypothetical protein [Bacteroidales bacterium]HPT12159.1 hypothetical protein [Bacteroidales bacterium]